MRILIADDSKTTRALLVESLKKLGHEPITAENGAQVLELFQAQRPDLVILDVIMEGIDGFEVARRLRALNSEEWIPIIFLSGAIDDENIAKGINAGGDDYLTKPYSEVTLAAKIKAMQRIADMRKKLCEASQQLLQLSSTDALTGIYNRLQFDRVIQEKISCAKRYHKSFALILIDVDRFKTINDTLGHPVGDLLLKEVAQRLKNCLRLEDFIARIGGDEFAVIISDIEHKNVVDNVAKKIVNAINVPYLLVGNHINVSTSLGISYFDETKEADIIQEADVALYHAKKSGRNNYKYFTQEINELHKQKMNLESALKMAVKNNELSVSYQPILHLITKKLYKLEALVSWEYPGHGRISPDIFIPLAEQNGLIEEIGEFVFRQVCQDASIWYSAGFKDILVSINLSPRQLLQENLISMLKDILNASKISAKHLEFELTETCPIIYTDVVNMFLKNIHNLGINFSLDDFGSGYSSMQHLKNLPISSIKISKAFVSELEKDEGTQKIIKSMINLGSNLNYAVVAEGIENDGQLEFLVKNGCLYGQGFLFYKPLPAKQIQELLRKETEKTSEPA